MAEAPRVLLLFSDTGGGHRSAAEAIVEALEQRHPARCRPEMVDELQRYAPRPFNHLPRAYPHMVRAPHAWRLGFRITDGRQRARALTVASWPYVRAAARRLVREQQADLVVSVHPLLVSPILAAYGRTRPPFLTVVTDLVSTHALWYHPGVDLCLLPTEAAHQRALRYGMPPERLRVVGLPVGARFCAPPGDPAALRATLGWPLDRPMVLVVGGGEGMGPLFEIACALDALEGRFGLAVIAGRNQRLRRRLETYHWRVPAFIYGFERRMPEMMRAATLLVTKAGPGTITEALNAGLPMVLFSRLPGQEEGNVDYAASRGAAQWAPGPRRSVRAVKHWLDHPQELVDAAAACRRLARPQAAADVADTIIACLATPAPDGEFRSLAASPPA
jgi:1,2-diacylglycerol 3-beta-galactosyltransferase